MMVLLDVACQTTGNTLVLYIPNGGQLSLSSARLDE